MTKPFTSAAVVVSLVLVAKLDVCAQQAAEPTASKPPVIFTTQQDQQNMLDQLGIIKLRPGRSPNADSPNAANYDTHPAPSYRFIVK